MKKLFLLSFIFLCSSCFQTAKDVERDRKINHLLSKLSEQQNLMAQITNKISGLEQLIMRLTGEVEETKYKGEAIKQELNEGVGQQLSQASEELQALKNKLTENEETITGLRGELSTHREFIGKITTTMKKNSAEKKIKVTKKNVSSALTMGESFFNMGKFSEAETIFTDVSKLKVHPGKLNRAYYYLGRISYGRKQYNNSLIYFSKIYAKWPKSSFAPSSLLFFARSLRYSGNKKDAKVAYKKLINSYKGTNEAKQAKKEITNV